MELQLLHFGQSRLGNPLLRSKRVVWGRLESFWFGNRRIDRRIELFVFLVITALAITHHGILLRSECVGKRVSSRRIQLFVTKLAFHISHMVGIISSRTGLFHWQRSLHGFLKASIQSGCL